MDEQEIFDLLFSNPDKLFTLIEQRGGSLDDLKKLEIGKLMARKRFPELVKQDSIDVVEFVLWFSYFVEREIRDSIFYVETNLHKDSKEIDKMLDEMTFGQKIKFIEEHYISNPKMDVYTKVLKDIKNLRNSMAHGELNKLFYGGYFLSDPRGQLKLGVDLRNASLRKNNNI